MAKHSTATALAARLRDAAALIEMIEKMDAGGSAAASKSSTVVPPAVTPAAPGSSPGAEAFRRKTISPKKQKRRRGETRDAILAQLRNFPSRTDAEIAKAIGCAHSSVNAVRRSLASTSAGDAPAGDDGDSADELEEVCRRDVA